MKPTFSNKKANMTITKVVAISLMVITIVVMFPSITSMFDFTDSSTGFGSNQKILQMECEGGMDSACLRLIKDCDDLKEEEKECSAELKEKWEAYKLVKDCERREDSCDEVEQEKWDEYKKIYILGEAIADLKDYNADNNLDQLDDDQDFLSKVNQIASELNTKPEYLLAVMNFETGGTFNPCERNKKSGATGLIQFMPDTATGLGTSIEDLCKMSRVEQLDYVKKHFMYKKGKLDTLEDVYMAVLWPKAVGKGSDYEIFDTQIQYNQNDGLDINHDGKITVAEATKKVEDNAGSILS